MRDTHTEGKRNEISKDGVTTARNFSAISFNFLCIRAWVSAAAAAQLGMRVLISYRVKYNSNLIAKGVTQLFAMQTK